MVTSIGKMTTSVLSQFGVCSKKAAIRLSTGTGKKLVDESVKLGRNLTNSEVVNVFKTSLPKKLRPKLLLSEQEAIEELIKRGASKELAELVLSKSLGAVINGSSKKSPLFINTAKINKKFGKNDLITGNATLAHELEHAIERNNTFKDIFKRKISKLVKNLLFKNYDKCINYNTKESIRFQQTLTTALKIAEPTRSKIIPILLKNLSGGSKAKEKIYKKVLNREIPAYTTGSNVELYGLDKVGSGVTLQDDVKNLYQKALDILQGKNIS